MVVLRCCVIAMPMPRRYMDWSSASTVKSSLKALLSDVSDEEYAMPFEIKRSPMNTVQRDTACPFL